MSKKVIYVVDSSKGKAFVLFLFYLCILAPIGVHLSKKIDPYVSWFFLIFTFFICLFFALSKKRFLIGSAGELIVKSGALGLNFDRVFQKRNISAVMIELGSYSRMSAINEYGNRELAGSLTKVSLMQRDGRLLPLQIFLDDAGIRMARDLARRISEELKVGITEVEKKK